MSEPERDEAARARRRRRRRWIALSAVAVPLVLVAVVRAFVGWVYPVASGSMRPTLRPGEWVFVRYDRAIPERFDLVVLAGGDGSAVVKRVWGLPEEKVLVQPTGDVLVGSRPIPPSAPRPDPILVFDQALHDVESNWNHGGTVQDPWRELEDGAVWEVDAREVARGSDAGLLRHHKGVRDDWVEADGTIRRGRETVHDVVVEYEVRVVEPGGRLRTILVEQGDIFEFSLELLPDSDEVSGILFRFHGNEVDGMAERTFTVDRGDWFRVRMSNVDDHVVVAVGDEPEVMTCAYDANTPHPLDHDRVGISQGERVRIGGEGCILRLRNIRVLRDLHVTQRGTYGVDRVALLGATELFVLGDHSAESRDSRETGPVDASAVRGRPVAVVWPPSAWRWVR